MSLLFRLSAGSFIQAGVYSTLPHSMCAGLCQDGNPSPLPQQRQLVISQQNNIYHPLTTIYTYNGINTFVIYRKARLHSDMNIPDDSSLTSSIGAAKVYEKLRQAANLWGPPAKLKMGIRARSMYARQIINELD